MRKSGWLSQSSSEFPPKKKKRKKEKTAIHERL
jgi:hypothetical protein